MGIPRDFTKNGEEPWHSPRKIDKTVGMSPKKGHQKSGSLTFVASGNLAGKSYLLLTGEFAYYHEKGKARWKVVKN